MMSCRASGLGLRASGGAAVIIVVVGMVGALHAQQSSLADRQWTFAVRLVQEGENDLAVDAFGDFLRDYPSDARAGDARYYLAVLAERQNRLHDALGHLAAVKSPIYVRPAAVSLLTGQVRLRQGDANAALKALEQVKPGQLSDAAARSSWHYLLGVCYRKLDNTQAAAAQFDKATEAGSPVKGRALLELGKCRLLLDQPDAASEAFGEVIRADDVDADAQAEARALAAGLAHRRGRYEAAADLYRQVIEQHQRSPYFGEAQVGLLRSLYAAGQYPAVLQRYESLAKLLPADAIGEGLYLKAAAEMQLKRYDQALATLDQYRRRTGDDHALRDEAEELTGLCYYHTDAGAFADWYAQHRPDSRRMHYLRALVAARQDQARQATGLLDQLIDPADGAFAAEALLKRATLHEQLGDPGRAADDLARYASRYPQAAQAIAARRRAVDLALNAGQYPRVIELAAQLEPDPPLLLATALAHLKLDHADAANERLDQLLKAGPNDRLTALGRFYRGMIHAAATDDDDARDRAVKDLDGALTGPLPDAQKTAALTTLARLHRAAGRDEAALETYEKLRAAQSTASFDPATALWVGRGLVEADRPEAALDWLQPALDSARLDEPRKAQAMYFQGRALHQLQRYGDAIQTYRRMLAFTTPKAYGYQGRLGLAQAYAASGDIESAMEEYDGLVSAPGSRTAATALYESAMVHLEQARRFEQGGMRAAADQQRHEARRRLQRIVILYDLRELDPLPLKARLMLGRLDVAAGRFDKAREHFQTVAAQNESPAWQDVAQAELKAIAEPAAGRTMLEKVVQQHPGTPAAAYTAARLRQGVAP